MPRESGASSTTPWHGLCASRNTWLLDRPLSAGDVTQLKQLPSELAVVRLMTSNLVGSWTGGLQAGHLAALPLEHFFYIYLNDLDVFGHK